MNLYTKIIRHSDIYLCKFWVNFIFSEIFHHSYIYSMAPPLHLWIRNSLYVNHRKYFAMNHHDSCKLFCLDKRDMKNRCIIIIMKNKKKTIQNYLCMKVIVWNISFSKSLKSIRRERHGLVSWDDSLNNHSWENICFRVSCIECMARPCCPI